MEHVTVSDLLAATGGRLLCGDPARTVGHIRLDSRQVGPGDLFVPLIGEKVDGHKFIPQVIAAGAAAVLTSEHDAPAESDASTGNNPALIRVDDTKRALQDIGRYLRARLTLPLIGVTGSVGKTTTRELIAAALSARYHVYKTPGNSNSQVGVPITISEITPEDEIGVIELGMSEPGELTVIAKIARIDAAVITNIGITHIEQLGSRENIYKEKMTIQDGLRDGGVLILNGDDDMLRITRGKDGVRTVYYGTGENCDLRAEDIVMVDGKARFTAVYGDERQPVRLEVLGEHNVLNALAGIAVCREYGMTLSEAARGLASFQGFAHRLQVYPGNVGGKEILILDDSYNASPASMKAALDVFAGIRPESRHIAVFADMKELGENSPVWHREVGEYAAERHPDLIVTLGEDCRELSAGVRARSDIPVREFTDREEMAAYLEREIREGDFVLFKGSNSMGLSKLADRYAGQERRG